MDELISWLLEGWFENYSINNADDYIPRTPLGWTRFGLLVGLIAQIDYVIYIGLASTVPTYLWFSLLANIVAYLAVRRMLKWRYPV